MTIKYITIAKFALASGYTEKAIRRKIEEGVWLENRHYRRAPDGHVLIDVEGVQQWVEGQLEPSSPSKGRSGSSSRSTERAA